MERSLKWFILMAAAGVTTAIAIELVTKRMQELAILSARAELQRLVVAAATQQQTAQAPVETIPFIDTSIQV